MKYGSLNGGQNGQHIGVDFVEIGRILATRDAIFFETKSSDLVQQVFGDGLAMG